MSLPSVCAVMLTRDRHELAPKAVACFLRQTYPNKALLIYDTGEKPLSVEALHVAHAVAPERGLPIGALRNNANRMVAADIIVHWDDDDWSHQDRILQQVANLQETGAELVGYNEMLFWRYFRHQPSVAYQMGDVPDDAAWLYTNSRGCLGTSFCYWRKTWEMKQFNDSLPKARDHYPYDGRGEDYDWRQDLKMETVSAFGIAPRMIARIHGANSSGQYANIEKSESWKRVPDWDEPVRRILEGE